MRPCLLALLCCGLCGYGQEQPRGGLVKLNVVALDSRGDPVGDLSEDDLQLRDQNKPYKIAFFHKNDATARIAAPEKLGPHEFSNRAAAAPPTVTLVLLDLVNLTMNQQGYARTQLANVLQKLESTDYVYLYLLTVRGPLAIRPLPEGPVEGAPGGWAKDVARMLDDAFGRVYRMSPDMYAEDRVKLTYMSLESVASRLAAFPGRKSIVWISRGVPIAIGPRNSTSGGIVDFEPLLRDFSATVDSATISIYPVGDLSAQSSREPQDLGAFDAPDEAPVGRGTGPRPQPQVQVTGGAVDTLSEMARMTGGRVHLNNDIGAAIRQAFQDAKLNYTIGYYPEEWDNKFHKIRLNCSRRGVKLLVKDGYYAYAGTTAEQEKAAIEEATWSPLDAGEIGVRVAVSPSRKMAQAVHLEIKIDANDIRMTRTDQDYSGQVSITYVAYDAEGRASVAPAAEFPFHMSSEQRNGALKGGMSLSQDRSAADTAQRIRLIVFDRAASTIGSVTIPLSPEDRSH
ncbi:MAG TPA: VWA domain-containing protein [Bryobacteraceae bacterium]|jgi:VWFA-related protein|nr:VWA domain-containing protein [Bryobacteraceae bacterium]